jgi:hypothetical protein
MIWWRAKGALEWRFGYCTYVHGQTMIRLGRWAGDTMGGSVVECFDIEWKRY